MEIKLPSANIINKAVDMYSGAKGYIPDIPKTYQDQILGIAEDCLDDYTRLPSLNNICGRLADYLSNQNNMRDLLQDGFFSGRNIFGMLNDMNGIDYGVLSQTTGGLDGLISKLSKRGLNIACLNPLDSMYGDSLSELRRAHELSRQVGNVPSNMQDVLLQELMNSVTSGVNGLGNIFNSVQSNIQTLLSLQNILCGPTKSSMSSPDYYDSPYNKYQEYKYDQQDQEVVV